MLFLSGLNRLKSYFLKKNDAVSVPETSPEPPKTLLGSVPPLAYESFSKEWQQLSSQDNFDGFRLEFSKPIMSNFDGIFRKPCSLLSNFSLFLGTSMTESNCFYNYGPTFSFEDGSGLLLARYNMGGQISMRGANDIFFLY